MKLFALCLAVLLLTGAVSLYQTTETRYCGPPVRNADGTIARSSAVTAAFQREHPCPTTGLRTGACPGQFKDHVIPVGCGGCDAVNNMQWLDTETKKRKDAFERQIYQRFPVAEADTAACVFKLQPMP